MPQLSYSENMAIARAGLMAAPNMSDYIISRACEEATGIPCGRFVCTGTLPLQQCLLPAAEADIISGKGLGVAIYDAAQPPGENAGNHEYDLYDVVPIIRKGPVWVFCNEDVDAGDAAYVTFQTGEKGTFGDTASADTAAVPGAYFVSASTTVTFADGSTQKIACVELNLPCAVIGPTGPTGPTGESE